MPKGPITTSFRLCCTEGGLTLTGNGTARMICLSSSILFWIHMRSPQLHLKPIAARAPRAVTQRRLPVEQSSFGNWKNYCIRSHSPCQRHLKFIAAKGTTRGYPAQVAKGEQFKDDVSPHAGAYNARFASLQEVRRPTSRTTNDRLLKF